MDATDKKYLLIVDDSKTNRAILRGIFEEEYSIVEAADGLEAKELLKRVKFAVIILDLNMPHVDGFQLLDFINSDKDLRKIPVVVNTQFGQEENELRALSKGAADFITKPYNVEIARHRVNNVITTRELQKQMVEAEIEKVSYERMRKLAETDSETGILSEFGFCNSAAVILQGNPDTPYSLLLLDIDHFKAVAELFGNDKSKEVLKSCAEYLKSTLGGNGICARIYNDVYVAMFPTDKFKSSELVEELETRTAALINGYKILFYSCVYEIDERNLPVKLILDRMSMVIQTVKGNLLSRHIEYNSEVKNKIMLDLELVNDTEDAIKRGDFCIHVQPIYDMRTGKVVTAEALVRWKHPTQGLLPPDKFIPLFEKNGMIAKLDHYVWESTCKLLKNIRETGDHQIPISVNVSRVNLFQPSLSSDLKKLMATYGVTSDELRLEITESARVEDIRRSYEAVENLKKAGFIIEMDDFGIGYSSLKVLQDMSIDVVKIDISFISKLSTSNKSMVIVRHMAQMAKELGMKVVAEGVETKEQLKLLQDFDCDMIQGYYFSKPLPEEDFVKLLKG
ncbi:MAG: EAL domain-containing protein [Lachnospiraceae bacterium]|nr:EAL domain-containing protein [Lachnospiraceae bacterium]